MAESGQTIGRGRGYVAVRAPDHPRASAAGYVYEHILVAERALGKFLPPGAQVHHINSDRADNRPGNLVICPDDAYHKLLHRRQRALRACGHADWRHCSFCGCWDAPENLYLAPSGWVAYHRICMAAYQKRRREGGDHAAAAS